MYQKCSWVDRQIASFSALYDRLMYALKVNMSALGPCEVCEAYTSKVNINMLTVNMTMRTTNLVLHDITTDMQVMFIQNHNY